MSDRSQTPIYALAIHTASSDLGLAKSNFRGDQQTQIWDLGRDLSTHLHLCLMEFLQPQTWQDLGWIAIAKGPGGFTGTRIGVVTAKTLAQQLNLPLFAISTLAGVAWSEAQKLPEVKTIAVQMQAQRGEVFGAIYQIQQTQSDHSQSYQQFTELLPDTVMSLAAWQQTLMDWQTPYHLVKAEGGLGSSAAGILELAYHRWQQGEQPHWSEVLPFYGQHPVDR